MRKNFLIVQHLTISLAILSVLLGIVFLSFSLVQNFLRNPKRYFFTDFSIEEIQFTIVYVSLIVTSVLVSYVIYLLLSSKTRTDISVLNTTKSLQKSKELFEKLYEGAPVPYIILSKDGEIREPNKATLRFFGATTEEIKGKNIFGFMLEEDKEKTERLYRHYKSKVPINREETRMITKSGAIKWVLLSIFEMRDPINYDKAGLAIIFDITEQKQLDQAKTAFLSLASHQLRTPIATIKWYMEMLLSSDFKDNPHKLTDYMARIYKVNESMIDLVETLLNISRIEMGSLKVDIKPTNVVEVCESVLNEMLPDIQRKNLIINKEYGGNLENIKSDPKLLRIVIQNLISNAVKYSKNGGSVTITLEESLWKKSITVADTGVGIPKNQQDRIFTKFFRADNIRMLENCSGTGLGLYLIKSIIETLGGKITFLSEENKGSIFTVEI